MELGGVCMVELEKLQDIETGLYLESSAYVYDLFLNEMENGRLIQNEI